MVTPEQKTSLCGQANAMNVSSPSGKRTTPLTIEEILAEPDFFEIEEERAGKLTLADLLQDDEPIDFNLPDVPVGDDEDDERIKEVMMRAEDIKEDPLQSLHIETFVCLHRRSANCVIGKDGLPGCAGNRSFVPWRR